MARITIKIIPEHADRTECAHKVTSVGKPTEPGCAGRAAYSARCSCGWHSEPSLRVLATEARDRHRAEHTAANAA